MSLSGIFNGTDYGMTKINDFVIGVGYTNTSGYTTAYTFDFLARIMTARTGSSDGGAVVKTFAELDQDALATIREELVRQGGKPPALASAESSPAKPRTGALNP